MRVVTRVVVRGALNALERVGAENERFEPPPVQTLQVPPLPLQWPQLLQLEQALQIPLGLHVAAKLGRVMVAVQESRVIAKRVLL